ncbi:putative guanosine-diphosphatase [Neolecta irregularis DAH-3]|uniref:guanosine-diphosphatase n=1 Tax=Neolecta irregularis (strain DAH-3) TaxID=1198029 RepID=A0A1U7LH40_NEOID|nr:putative guanosine-diphosphatase [Neolecta irregularis DAH-3]|eukprot:OLL21913.1 putative guanosine-diphosphatase [Neolecta irregularis DAH-3]
MSFSPESALFRQRTRFYSFFSRKPPSRSNLNSAYYDPYEKPRRYSDMSSPITRARIFRIVSVFAGLLVVAWFFLPESYSPSGPLIKETNPWTPISTPPSYPSSHQLHTTKCNKSADVRKPIVQFVLMIDAGSTGSRVHVYKFNNCDISPELESEVFEQTKPGLSSYGTDPEGAAKSLDSLLQVGMKNVPNDLYACTPVAVKATAGLRLLGEGPSKAILEAVETRLRQNFPFPVVSDNGVSIMDGKDEGVYAWITANYLLGNIGPSKTGPTAAILDLGGGSTQIVFEPTFGPAPEGGKPEELAPGDHKYILTFGGRSFTLYQHSHLGYGLMEARKLIHRAVAKNAKDSAKSDNWKSQPIINPCIPPGMSRLIDVELDGETLKLGMTGPSTPSASQCRYFAENILNKEAHCPLLPCSFNGAHQPSLDKTFAREDVYIFSYFYDRTAPLGMPSSFTLDELRSLTANVCTGDVGWSPFEAIQGAIVELTERPEWCLDLNFISVLLGVGYDMPLDREVKIAKKLKGNELGWCLGASLPLLENQDCKVKELS